MSEIIVTGNDDQEQPEEKQEDLKYQATEADEERFFLMYHLHFQPSEADNLDEDYRKWLIARFVAQKNLEREMMQRHQLRAALGPDLTKGPSLRLQD